LSEQIKFTHHTQGPIISQAPTAAQLMITAKPATASKYFCIITRTDNRDNNKGWLEERR
jgi:hypothetical protein